MEQKGYLKADGNIRHCPCGHIQDVSGDKFFCTCCGNKLDVQFVETSDDKEKKVELKKPKAKKKSACPKRGQVQKKTVPVKTAAPDSDKLAESAADSDDGIVIDGAKDNALADDVKSSVNTGAQDAPADAPTQRVEDKKASVDGGAVGAIQESITQNLADHPAPLVTEKRTESDIMAGHFFDRGERHEFEDDASATVQPYAGVDRRMWTVKLTMVLVVLFAVGGASALFVSARGQKQVEKKTALVAVPVPPRLDIKPVTSSMKVTAPLAIQAKPAVKSVIVLKSSPNAEADAGLDGFPVYWLFIAFGVLSIAFIVWLCMKLPADVDLPAVPPFMKGFSVGVIVALGILCVFGAWLIYHILIT